MSASWEALAGERVVRYSSRTSPKGGILARALGDNTRVRFEGVRKPVASWDGTGRTQVVGKGWWAIQDLNL
jgi:hypothetical protein